MFVPIPPVITRDELRGHKPRDRFLFVSIEQSKNASQHARPFATEKEEKKKAGKKKETDNKKEPNIALP